MTTKVALADMSASVQGLITRPRITSVTSTYSNFTTTFPDNVVTTGGGFIVIRGLGFLGNEQVFIRSIGSKSSTLATSISYISSTQLNCIMPSSTAGSKMLYVVNLDGETAISTVTYQYVL
jgi:hypothetical protein